jgi:UDP-glucose 4-epimerase
MKILVTGGLGVNGAWVIRALLREGHQPISFDTRDDVSLVADIADSFDRRIGDVLDLDRLTQAMRGVDVVVHMAALIPAERDPYKGYMVNAMGSVTLYEAAHRAGVRRVVFTSAKAVYGAITGVHGYPTYQPVPESYSRSTHSTMPVYSASKLLAEEAGRHYARTFGLEFLALRFATIFGPGKQKRHGTIGAISAIVENTVAGEPTVLESGGDEYDELIYVRDAARAVVLACMAPMPRDWDFNIGSGIFVSLREYALAVQEEIANVDIRIGPGRDPLKLGLMYGRFDTSRAMEQLKFRPEYDLRRGLRDYAETIRSGIVQL